MKIHPVIHINSFETAVAQSNRALDAGADGVFFIDHTPGVDGPNLTFDTLRAVRERNPHAQLGINLLGHSTLAALTYIATAVNHGRIEHAPDALWVDDAWRGAEQAHEFKQGSPSLASIRLFGGVAFKYTLGYTDIPAEAAEQARRLSPFIDVITTSGKGTGSAPSREKLAAMRAATEKPIAVASGISAQNVTDYTSLVDDILIASSIETEPYSGVFDEVALRRAISAIHEA